MLIFRWDDERENADLLIICGGIFGEIVDQMWKWVISGYDIDKLWDGYGQHVDFWPIFCPHFLCPSKRKEHPLFYTFLTTPELVLQDLCLQN